MAVTGRTRWIPHLIVIVLAVMALWPMSVYPGLFHRTPNTPLHLLVLEHLDAYLRGDVYDLAMVVAADWPTGRPVRVIGWPFQLMALPLVGLIGAVPALNLALLLSLILSGVCMVWMLERMGLGVGARAIGGAAWVLNPFLIGFLSNGQYENHVGWAFPLVWIGLARGGLRGGLILALALVAAAFSSPYQAVPVAVILMMALLFQRREDPWGALALLTVAFLACYQYFSGPQPIPGGECGPTSGAMPAVLTDLVRNLSGLPIAPQMDRWQAWTSSLGDPVYWSKGLHLDDLGVTPSVAFLGFVPLIGGAIGLWTFRDKAWTSPITWGGIICGVLALGGGISINRVTTLDGPMPWDLAALMPGLSEMGTTLRFMTGTVFALVVGLALLTDWLSRAARAHGFGHLGVGVILTLLSTGVGVDWLYGTVSPVPMNGLAMRAPEGFDALPDTGAVMAVPVLEQVPPEAHLWISVVVGRPVVGYCRTDIDQMRQEYRLVDYAQGGKLPDPALARRELEQMAERGILYLAFVVAEPGRDRFGVARQHIARLLGPPDAEGDGVFGYRTERSPR
jgi:hypothetical protein